MAIDLTPRWDNFAVYLPALQYGFASAVESDSSRDKNRPFPKGIKLTDLDFLNPKSKLWHYGYGLYSAGQFDSAKNRACAVTNRDKNRTTILGDSGGYQIGKGTLKGTEHLKKLKTSAEVCDGWRKSGDVRKWIVNWLNANSDYAMTIDMPLWAKLPTSSASPFHKCSNEQLIEMTVENLEYIKHHTNGRTKWLNILQGTTDADSKQWWDAIKSYRLGGWALAGSVGWRGGIESVMHNVLMMRDDNAFEDGQDWMHVLGLSQPVWAVMLTAIQRGLRAKCNPKFRISFDSASPFQAGGRYQNVVRYPKFGKNFDSWVLSAHEAPVNPIYAATKDGDLHFPYASPIGDLLTLNHLNVKGGSFQKVPYDAISNNILINHNVYIYVRSLLEANELAFMGKSEADKAVPQALLDVCDVIEGLIGESTWKKKLRTHDKLFSEVFSKKYPTQSDADELR